MTSVCLEVVVVVAAASAVVGVVIVGAREVTGDSEA